MFESLPSGFSTAARALHVPPTPLVPLDSAAGSTVDASFEMSQQAKPLGEISWSQPAQKGDKPTPRSGHTITVAGEKAVIFGGCGITKDNEPIVSNQTFYLTLTADPMKWEEVRTPTPPGHASQ